MKIILLLLSCLSFGLYSGECSKEFLTQIAQERISTYNRWAIEVGKYTICDKVSPGSIFKRDLLKFIGCWSYPLGDDHTINLSECRLTTAKNLIAYCALTKIWPLNVQSIDLRSNNIHDTVDIQDLCATFVNLKEINLRNNSVQRFIWPSKSEHEITIYVDDNKKELTIPDFINIIKKN